MLVQNAIRNLIQINVTKKSVDLVCIRNSSAVTGRFGLGVKCQATAYAADKAY